MSNQKQEDQAKANAEPESKPKPSQEIDWGKVREMEARLNQLEEEKRAKARLFDPKDLVKHAKAVREIYDEDLGTIRYVLLNYKDLNEIVEKYPDNKERSIQFLLRQLAPVNKDLTEEDIKALPYEVVVRLLAKLQKEGSFFHQATSPNGSTSTQEPKPSDSSPLSTATSFK